MNKMAAYQLPVKPETGGRKTEGFMTPSTDKMPQKVSVPPKRVVPIVFLPGIMGSNLRMSAQRQRDIGKKNNIAWRPENLSEGAALMKASPARRQSQLDPQQTEVDIYEPARNPTGDPKETADQRHDNAAVAFDLSSLGINTPLLMDDPLTAKPRKTKEQKARERGWGEVFFDTYGQLLQMCEERLNTAFQGGKLNPWWKQVVNVDPSNWQAAAMTGADGKPQEPLKPVTEDELKEAVRGCWFPVHALGYNWLESNRDSARKTAKRISALIEQYNAAGFECEKVILVTHSMGGLVARALIHPDIGGMQDKVLGVVHGVMPAIGAAAAYRRMRCGTEGGAFNVVAKVLGNTGPKVTAVMANSVGGLELLPSQAYGNGWLNATYKGQTVMSLPSKGDPYEEIYKVRGKWYGLLREDWINPAESQTANLKNVHKSIDKAKAFHRAIAQVYHANSFAHYGADRQRPAWHHVTWQIGPEAGLVNMEKLVITRDSEQGRLRVVDPTQPGPPGATTPGVDAILLDPADPGDETVPAFSADHQLRSGKFKGVFRQAGYEHQASYADERALFSTVYSLVRIAQSMSWARA